MINPRRPFLIFASVTLCASLGACNFREDKEEVAEDTSVITQADLHYATVNERVFRPFCFSCHSAAGGNQGGINLETFATVTAELSSIKASAIDERSMPPSSSNTLSTGAYNLLKTWIEAGGPE